MGKVSVLSLYLGCALLAACDSAGESKADKAQEWLCFDYGSSCECELRPACLEEDGCTRIGSGTEVPSCELYECCLASEDSDGSPVCSCTNGGADCDARAASMPGTEVVNECPVGGAKPIAGACAQVGENCTDGYLSDKELTGCCEGSICDINKAGILTCRKADADDQALAKMCEHTARNIGEVDYPQQALVGKIQTDLAPLPLDEIDFLFSSLVRLLASQRLTLHSEAQRAIATYIFLPGLRWMKRAG